MAINMKQIENEAILCFKSGSFYHCYGKDSYIISYLFGYKINTVNGNIPTCGFPVNSLNRIMAKLEQNKIDYLVIEPRRNYDVEEKMEFKNLNTYNEVYEKAHEYIRVANRINEIAQTLKDNIGKEETIEKIRKVEEIVYAKK